VNHLFEAFLRQHDSAAWARARRTLMPSIHEVDRTATDIWFHFYPLPLAEAFSRTNDPALLAQELRLDGNYRLAGQHDTSHWFLYGHRYWRHIKAAIVRRAESDTPAPSLELASIIHGVAKEAGSAAGVEEPLVAGIAAVGLMTLQQTGLADFRDGSGASDVPAAFAKKRPADMLAARHRDDRQGLMGFVRGIRARYTVTFDERRDAGTFPVILQQHLTTASALDTREYPSTPRRCHEGPIPVQCRTASCGTCWVGVLGGAEKLSEVDEMERRRMKEFGYVASAEARPTIRLACMAAASGNVTIVIPTWNGFLGKAGLGGS
jgi:ferredoxin